MNYLVKRGSGSSDFEIHNNSPQKTYDEHTVNWWRFHLKTDSNEIVYEKIDDAMKNINLENLFSELCGYAAGYFDTTLNPRLEVCDSTISIGQNENTVYMNSMMSSAYFSFLLTHIYHSYVMDNMNDEVKEAEELFCFRALLFILNEMCFYDFEQPADFPDAESIDMLFAKILLYFLHIHDAYGDRALPEETVFDDIKKGVLELTESEYKAAVSNLLKIKSVSISDDRIKLNEKVILKY